MSMKIFKKEANFIDGADYIKVDLRQQLIIKNLMMKDLRKLSSYYFSHGLF